MVELESQYNNLERNYRQGFIDTSGNIIVPEDYLFLGLLKGCNRILVQEYIIDGLPYYEYNNYDPPGYLIFSMDGKSERLPVDEITYFGNDWFIVRKDSLWGIMGCDLNWILEPAYKNQIGATGDNLFIFRDTIISDDYWGDNWETGLQGTINLSGDTIIPPDYLAIHPLDWWSELYYIVEDYSNRAGLLDSKGNVVIPVDDHLIYPSIADESVWIIEKDKTKVYYPLTGEWISENPEKTTAGIYGFESGLTLRVDRDWEYYATWVDQDRKIDISADPYNIKMSFEKPYLCYVSQDGYFGIVNRKGDTIVPFNFEQILMDEEEYFYEQRFTCISEGTAVVRSGYSWAMIDTTGRYLTHFFYSHIGKMRDGLAPAEKNGRWGYIDRNGHEAVPFIFSWAGELEYGLGEVFIVESKGLINPSGHVVYKTWTDEEYTQEASVEQEMSPIEEMIGYTFEEYESEEEVALLDISLSQCTRFPEEFYRFPNVTEMFIYEYRMPELDFRSGEFDKLRYLYINDSKLEQMPGGILYFTELVSLDLNNNRLIKVPRQLFYHPKLNFISLDINQVEHLPENIPLNRRLAYLSLGLNNIRTVPTSISNLKNLDDLNLSGNEISSLPAEIGQLKQLIWLDVSDNYLETLPPEMAGLKKLTYLYLSDNQLTSIPAWISELKSLKELDLEDNNITRVPDEILNMKKLEKINLKKNPVPEAEKERINKICPDLVIFDE